MATRIELSKNEKNWPLLSSDPDESEKRFSRKQFIRELFFVVFVHGKELTVDDLPDDPCIRCGYLFLNTDWIFRLFGKTDPMKPACSLHDSLYDRELNGDLSRKEADLLFLEAMKALVRDGKGSYTQAYLYYYIARSTGWAVW